MLLQQEVLVQGLSRAGVCLPEPFLLGWGGGAGGGRWLFGRPLHPSAPSLGSLQGASNASTEIRRRPSSFGVCVLVQSAVILMDMHLSIKAVQQSKMFLLQDRGRHKINVQT